jgi:hypothetical protein
VALEVGKVVFWSVIASTPLALFVFAPRRWGGGFFRNGWRLLRDYPWHWLLLFLIIIEKNWVDTLNDPIRGLFGDYTWLVAHLEGDLTYKLQHALENQTLTALLTVHYLWGYIFLNYFSVIYYAYRDDREMANLASLNYSIIYLLSIPFYVFFNVEITSDYIPGMKALLYHSGPGFYSFFTAHDPLDNAFPSLHVAIPFGLNLLQYWTMKRRGYTWRDWEHRGYFRFTVINSVVFAFSILYLGIHWITDIPGGIIVGLIGATIADEWHADLFGQAHRLQDWLVARIQRGWVALRRPRAT